MASQNGYNQSRKNEHAIVIGGSMAGLLAARVLSEHFKRVTLIERDLFPTNAENRKGVPQGRHLHALLVKGEQIISKLFPGLPDELAEGAEGGAYRLDLSGDILWYQNGGYKTRFESGITMLSMSRPFLEANIRRRARAIENLTCIEECDVNELITSADKTDIKGVKLQRRDTKENQSEEILEADLVVDASGRGSKSPKWLETLGYPKPEETKIKINFGYTTRMYRRDDNLLKDAKGILTMPVLPDGKRGAVLYPIEGGRWIVTLGGYLGDHAPADEQGFLDFARSLATQDVYNLISRAEPLNDFSTHRFSSSLRHHYERMSHFPEGYLITGDALCSFNPIYGQGMTVAAMDAEALDVCLKTRRGDLHGIARDFFNRASIAIDNAWRLASSEDFRFPGVEGKKPFGTDLINWYIKKLQAATLRDSETTRAFFRVMTMTHSPNILFSPRIIYRVIKNSLMP